MNDQEENKTKMRVLPRLPTFSGEGEMNFDQWQFEVDCLVKEKWPEDELKLLIRRSLKGKASRTLMNLGVNASVEEIITKFKNVFGTILTASSVMAQLYSLRQNPGEDAGVFASRLEDCAHQAVKLGRVTHRELDALLKEAFCAGLRSQTKLATGYLIENKKLSFDELTFAVKRKERDLGEPQAKAISEVAELRAQVAQLTTELKALKGASHSGDAARVQNDQQHYRYEQGRDRYHRPQNNFRAASNSNRATGGSVAFPPRTGRPVTCYRCGAEGHIARGCRNNIPSSLNSRTPMGAANPWVKQQQASWGRHL